MIKDTLVVTPSLGIRQSLKRTIKSVKEIGGERVKHVLTCPRSVLKSLQQEYPDIQIIAEPKESKGIYPALNNAIFKFGRDFKYITYINDDDYWLPDFKQLFFKLDNNIDIDAVYGKVLFMNENNEIIKEMSCSPRYKAFKPLFKNKIVLFTQQATLFRSELYYNVGGFDENYKLISDSKFWIKAIEAKAKFQFINTLAASYTLQSNQLSSDIEFQNKEYDILFQESFFKQLKTFEVLFETILFRLYNLHIYIKRICL